MSKWIKTSEQLPSGDKVYGICWDGHEIIWFFYSVERKAFCEGNRFIKNVTHWQPLPAPPEEE